MFGILALLFAGAAAGWLLWRLARGEGADESKNVTVLKIIVWLGLAAVLLAAKLWPLAFMVLIAASGVMAIEMWRGKSIPDGAEPRGSSRVPSRNMTPEEAAEVLGLAPDAPAETIRSAHKKLIAQIHPDKGGTNYLAAKINEARDVLLRRAEGGG